MSSGQTQNNLWTRTRAFAFRAPVLFSLAAYCVTFIVALPFAPGIWENWITNPKRVYDHNIYMDIATGGYTEPAQPAFYPLWPWILSVASALPGPLFTILSNVAALICFGLGLFVLDKILRTFTLSSSTRLWAISAFALNPNSIFHGIGYPESFFSLLVTVAILKALLWIKGGKIPDLLGALLMIFLMGLTRPIVLQFGLSAVLTMALTPLILRDTTNNTKNAKRQRLFVFLTLGVLACALGYLPFGFHCLGKFGNFWQPFDAQKYWDRTPGLHWTLFTNPRSVGGSDNVLVWDLHAFYLPAILVAGFLVRALNSPGKESGRPDIPAWSLGLLCALIAAAHSGIAFVTYPIFMSLGRHVLATPFFFIAAAILIDPFLTNPKRARVAFGWVAIAALYLIHFWTRFARVAWIG